MVHNIQKFMFAGIVMAVKQLPTNYMPPMMLRATKHGFAWQEPTEKPSPLFEASRVSKNGRVITAVGRCELSAMRSLLRKTRYHGHKSIRKFKPTAL